MKKRGIIAVFLSILLTGALIGVVPGDSEAKELPTIKWKCVTSMGPGTIWWDESLRIPKMVEAMSGGRFKIQVFPPGALVAAFEAFDAVMNGSVECCNTWAGYASGKNKGLSAIDCVGAGMNNWDLMCWYYQHGGKKICDELLSKLGVVGWINFINCHEQGFLTGRPIKTLRDFKGLKLRVANLETRLVIDSLGATAINMPGGEVYEALKRGVIDGIEMGTTYPDWQMGLHEIAKYWSLPIWHQRASAHWFMVGKKAYDSLPDEYKAMLYNASLSSTLIGATEQEYTSAVGTKKFLQAGVKQVYLDQATINRIEEEMIKVKQKLAAENPDYKKVVESMRDYLDYMREWRKTIKPYGHGEEPPFYRK